MSKVHPKTPSTINALILTFTCLFIFSSFGNAQTYPTGFQQVLVANGISNPTVMAFAPDGRLFVAQQSGALRIIENEEIKRPTIVNARIKALIPL